MQAAREEEQRGERCVQGPCQRGQRPSCLLSGPIPFTPVITTPQLMGQEDWITDDNHARRVHRHSTRFVQELIGRWDDFGERTLSIDGEANGRTALGKFRSGLEDINVEVRLVEESVSEGGACKAAARNSDAESWDRGIAGHGGVEKMARCSLWVNSLFRK